MYRLSPLRPVVQAQRRCPACGAYGAYRHGRIRRWIQDTRYWGVELLRMRCVRCGHTYRVYPKGLAPGRWRSERVRQLGVFLYALGLSLRRAEAVLRSLEVHSSDTSILRDVEEAGEQARRYHERLRGRVKVRRVGMDGTGVPMAGEKAASVVVVVDLDQGDLLRVEAVDETDVEGVTRLVKEVIEAFEPAEVVTDEAPAYQEAMQRLAQEEGDQPIPVHRLCAAHFRRNKARRLSALARAAQQAGRPLLALEARALKALLRSPPQTLAEIAHRWHRGYLQAAPPQKGQQASLDYQMRMLTLELWEKAKKVSEETNNATERAIANAFKVRTKTMRGFKKAENRDRFLYLGGWLYAHRHDASLEMLLP